MTDCWQFSQFGLEHLSRAQGARDPLLPGQVRVAIKAVSLNYRDLLMVRGHYNPRQPLPLIPCSDGAGEVIEVHPDEAHWKVGDRVCGLFNQSWQDGPPDRSILKETLGGPLPGTLQAERCFPSHGLIATPEHLSDAAAATLPCAGLTAWSALEGIPAGGSVVVLGTGGVSLFALQFAHARGLQVAVTSSSDAKLEQVRKLGADYTVNYSEQPEWGKAIRQWRPEGVDCVIEVGGAGTLEQSIRCLKPGGQVSMIGVLAGTQSPINVLPILMQQLRIQGIMVGHAVGFAAMNRFLSEHRLQPVLDSEFPFAQAPQAFARLASGAHSGKVVVTGPW